MKARTTSSSAFITCAIANGAIPPREGEETLWYLRPTEMETQRKRFPLYRGCGSAGCRTFKDCICRCKDCSRWCKYRGVTIVDTDGTVNIRFADGRLIVFMPRAEYDTIKHHWERLGLKLEPPAPTDGVTPV